MPDSFRRSRWSLFVMGAFSLSLTIAFSRRPTSPSSLFDLRFLHLSLVGLLGLLETGRRIRKRLVALRVFFRLLLRDLGVLLGDFGVVRRALLLELVGGPAILFSLSLRGFSSLVILFALLFLRLHFSLGERLRRRHLLGLGRNG